MAEEVEAVGVVRKRLYGRSDFMAVRSSTAVANMSLTIAKVIGHMDTAGGYGIHPLSKISESELAMNILKSPAGGMLPFG